MECRRATRHNSCYNCYSSYGRYGRCLDRLVDDDGAAVRHAHLGDLVVLDRNPQPVDGERVGAEHRQAHNEDPTELLQQEQR